MIKDVLNILFVIFAFVLFGSKYFLSLLLFAVVEYAVRRLAGFHFFATWILRWSEPHLTSYSSLLWRFQFFIFSFFHTFIRIVNGNRFTFPWTYPAWINQYHLVFINTSLKMIINKCAYIWIYKIKWIELNWIVFVKWHAKMLRNYSKPGFLTERLRMKKKP